MSRKMTSSRSSRCARYRGAWRRRTPEEVGAVYIGALRIELYMPQCRTLKEKRQVVKSIIDRTRGRFNVAVAEVDKQDLWQVCSLGITCVSNSEYAVRELLNRVDRSVRGMGKAEVLESPITIFTP
jgi:uncharacterized protein YlxP (DUF503 family)